MFISTLKNELSQIFPQVDYWFDDEELSLCKVYFMIEEYHNQGGYEKATGKLFFLRNAGCELDVGYLFNSVNSDNIKGFTVIKTEEAFSWQENVGRQLNFSYILKDANNPEYEEKIEIIKNDKNEIIGEKS